MKYAVTTLTENDKKHLHNSVRAQNFLSIVRRSPTLSPAEKTALYLMAKNGDLDGAQREYDSKIGYKG